MANRSCEETLQAIEFENNNAFILSPARSNACSCRFALRGPKY